ncbi:MAG TPA: 4-hydroxyphenylpyruvate dioxygenase [Blastocatellia bacterium]|nr:4-hydroxyphenylpyruvate dioxygenase [Blastocatellia bacterium]
MTTRHNREAISDSANPLGLDGIEYIEYATNKPQALGQVLEMMGFRPIARHRSREVTLYHQGRMNIIVNAHVSDLPRAVQPAETPVISALALRVRSAAAAYHYVIEQGAWAAPTRVEVMELNIPAVHGAGDSRIYFVDRYQDFSIYDVDFTLIPAVDPYPPALAGMRFFGVVQYIGANRMEDWMEFYARLFAFRPLPDGERFGIMPKGRVLRSPCGSFYLQLIGPDSDVGPNAGGEDAWNAGGEDAWNEAEGAELLQRVGFGVPDVPAAVAALRARGLSFVSAGDYQTNARGALTQRYLGGLMFEIVHDERHGL